MADGSSLPVSLYTAPASPHEATLLQDTLAQSFTDQWLEHLIGDKAYDSDPLDCELAEEGVEMIELCVSSSAKR